MCKKEGSDPKTPRGFALPGSLAGPCLSHGRKDREKQSAGCPRPGAPPPAGCSRAPRFSSKTLGASSPGTAAAGRAKGSSSELTETPKVNRCPPCSARAQPCAALPAEPATHFPP